MLKTGGEVAGADNSSSRSRVWIVVPFLLLLCGLSAFWRRPPIDDAYITFRYAFNVVNGIGFQYNGGDWVLGTTTPLWGCILAVLKLLGADIEQSAVFGGVAASAAITAAFLLRLPTKEVPLTAVLLWGGALCTYYPLSVVSWSGMETALYTATVVMGLYACGTGRPLLWSLCAVAATLLRPDGFLVLAAGLASTLRRAPRLSIQATLVYLALMLPFVALAYYLYGEILPHSIAAKRVLYPASVGKNLLYLFEALSQTPFDAVLLCCGGAGLLTLLSDSRLRVYPVWSALYGAAIVFSGVKPLFFWYFGPVWFLLLTVGMLGFFRLFQRSEFRWMKPAVVMPLLLVAIIYDTAVRASAFDEVLEREDAYRAIVRDFSPQIARGSSVLVGETGILGYGFPNAYIIDSSGINSEAAFSVMLSARKEIGPNVDLHRSAPWAQRMIQSFKPDWIIASRLRMQLPALEEQAWFKTSYDERGAYALGNLGGVVVLERIAQ